MDDLELSQKAFYDSGVKAYITSRLLLASNYLAPVGLYNAHLAVECLLKSLIAQTEHKPPLKHDLIVLNQKLYSVTKDADLTAVSHIEALKHLNPFQELGRYGSLAREQFDPDRIDTPGFKAFGVMTYQPSSEIKRIDKLFSALRSKAEVDYDPVAQIITDQQESFICQQWKLPIPIQEVLLHQNDSLKK